MEDISRENWICADYEYIVQALNLQLKSWRAVEITFCSLMPLRPSCHEPGKMNFENWLVHVIDIHTETSLNFEMELLKKKMDSLKGELNKMFTTYMNSC